MSEWQTKSLGELTEIKMGGTPARDTPSFWDERKTTGNVWVSIADLSASSGMAISDSKEYISDAAADGRRRVPKGSLLMSFKLSIGKLAFAGTDLFTNEAIAAFILPAVSEVTKEYLYHYLDHLDWTSLAVGSEKVKGATLNKAKLQKLLVSFPSLQEQARIVAFIEATGEMVRKLQDNLEVRRASLGLFEETTIASLIDPAQEGWISKPLSSWCSIATGPFGTQVHKSDYKSDGPALINPQDIVNGQIHTRRIKRVSPKKAEELGRWTLRKHDLVLGRRGEMGRCAVVDDEFAGSLCGTGSFILRPNESCNPFLLAEFLRSSLYRNEIERLATGATMGNLNNKVLARMNVSFPPEDQKVAVLNKIRDLRKRVIEIQHLGASMTLLGNELMASLLLSRVGV